jgi:hypothetical protein
MQGGYIRVECDRRSPLNARSYRNEIGNDLRGPCTVHVRNSRAAYREI